MGSPRPMCLTPGCPKPALQDPNHGPYRRGCAEHDLTEEGELPRRQTIKLVILGKPITKKNSSVIILNKRTNRPIVIPSRQARQYEKDSIPQIQAQWHRVAIDTPINLCARIYRERLVGDLGNYLSAVCDILERAGVVTDDKYIAGFDGSRLDKDAKDPRVVIEISAL